MSGSSDQIPAFAEAIDAEIDRPDADAAIAALDAALRQPGPDASLRLLRAVRIDVGLVGSVRDRDEAVWLRRFLAEDGQDVAPKRREGGPLRVAVAAVAAACVVVAALTTLLVLEKPAAVGRVVAVSADAGWQGSAGDVVRVGDVIGLESGFVTLELGDDVVVDFVGATRARVRSAALVELRAGLVAGRVGPRGTGFTVRTEDAEVVDLGTRFLVHKNFESGTQVRVTEGAVSTRLLDRDGATTRVVDLVAGESLRVDVADGVADGLDGLFDVVAAYEPVRRAKGRVRRFSGAAKPLSSEVVGLDFRSGRFETSGYVYVIPEASGVVLDEPLTLDDSSGGVVIPAGTVVDSYLLHCDMGKAHAIGTLSEGSLRFGAEVAAVVRSTAGLAATDGMFATAGSRFEAGASRGLDGEDDVLRVSPDRQTISFDWSLTDASAVDQALVLVLGTAEVVP
ncbi:MAG: FecR domain-containing protein [Planctomycetota bacterium]